MSSKARIVLLALVAAGLTLGGCARQAPATTQDQAAVTETRLDGFELQGDPKSAIEYQGNKLIFSAEVLGLDAPRKVSRVTESGDRVAYIYTPVNVKINQVFKGDRGLSGRTVAIRAIGGQIGTEKTVGDINPAPAAYVQGMALFLFTQDFVDAGDGLTAATPNFTFALDTKAGNAYNLHNPEWKTSKDAFSMQIAEWVAWNR